MWGNVYVAQSPENYNYDADGNLTSDGHWTYTWDGENRLVSMQALTNIPTGAKLRLDFVYDYQFRRIQKTVSTNNGSGYFPQSTNRFIYDRWNLVGMLNTQSSIIQSFVWGSDLSGGQQGAGGIGGLLAIGDTVNGTYVAAYDANGNIGGLVKAADGTLGTLYEYGPFGELIRSSGLMAKTNSFRFSSKYQDNETDLIYYGYRYYSPYQGCWINKDPFTEPGAGLSIGPANSESCNLYSFIKNNPVNYYDSLGLKCCLKTWSWGLHPGEGSIYPHSALQCDDGTYISAFPTGGAMGGSPVAWSTEAADTRLYGTPDSTICSDCIDQSKVAAWKNSLSNPQYVFASANCSDYTLQAIIDGLDPNKQIRPPCPKTCLLDRLFACTWILDDVLSPPSCPRSGGSGITTPAQVASRLVRLIENNCNRYKCVRCCLEAN